MLCWKQLWEAPPQIPLFHSAKHPIHTQGQQLPAQHLFTFLQTGTQGRPPDREERETKAPRLSCPTGVRETTPLPAPHRAERIHQLPRPEKRRGPLRGAPLGAAAPSSPRKAGWKQRRATYHQQSEAFKVGAGGAPAALARNKHTGRGRKAAIRPLHPSLFSSAGRGVTAVTARLALRQAVGAVARARWNGGWGRGLARSSRGGKRGRGCTLLLPCRHVAAAGESFRAEADHPPAAGQGGGSSAAERLLLPGGKPRGRSCGVGGPVSAEAGEVRGRGPRL